MQKHNIYLVRWLVAVGITWAGLALMISKDSNGDSEASTQQTTSVTPTVIQEVVETTTTTMQIEASTTTSSTPETTTTTTTTTTEVPLASDPLDYIDEQRAMHGRCGEWYDTAISVGWTDAEWATLSKVIYRESRCTIDAWNGHDAGLVQINEIHTKWMGMMGFKFPEDMFNPTNNLYFARRLWETSGWKPWKASSGK
jgi:hypothetical protein